MASNGIESSSVKVQVRLIIYYKYVISKYFYLVFVTNISTVVAGLLLFEAGLMLLAAQLLFSPVLLLLVTGPLLFAAGLLLFTMR